jgi:hypothetical protein
LQTCFSLHLVHWSFVKLPLIPPGLTNGVPSILTLKSAFNCFLSRLALSNLFQDFIFIN